MARLPPRASPIGGLGSSRVHLPAALALPNRGAAPPIDVTAAPGKPRRPHPDRRGRRAIATQGLANLKPQGSGSRRRPIAPTRGARGGGPTGARVSRPQLPEGDGSTSLPRPPRGHDADPRAVRARGEADKVAALEPAPTTTSRSRSRSRSCARGWTPCSVARTVPQADALGARRDRTGSSSTFDDASGDRRRHACRPHAARVRATSRRCSPARVGC